jgi:hypothetical protein
MAKKNRYSEDEKREQFKTEYHGIDGLKQRLIDNGVPEDRVEKVMQILLETAMRTGITLESVIDGFIQYLKEQGTIQ